MSDNLLDVQVDVVQLPALWLRIVSSLPFPAQNLRIIPRHRHYSGTGPTPIRRGFLGVWWTLNKRLTCLCRLHICLPQHSSSCPPPCPLLYRGRCRALSPPAPRGPGAGTRGWRRRSDDTAAQGPCFSRSTARGSGGGCYLKNGISLGLSWAKLSISWWIFVKSYQNWGWWRLFHHPAP